MTSLVHDIRYSIRALAKSPLLTGAVLLVLALGIGMNSALFSVVNTVLLAPTSNYTDHPERALVVFGKDPQSRRKTIAYPDYQEMRAQCDACEQLAAYRWQPITVTGFKDPFRVGGLATSANYFAAIGWKPLLGRVYTAAEDRVAGSGVAVLNYQIWQKRFGGNPDILGQSLNLNGRPHTVIGVLPPGYDPLPQELIHVPIEVASDPTFLRDRNGPTGVFIVARARPDQSEATVRNQLETISSRLASEYPDSNAGSSVTVASIQEVQTSRYRATIWMLFGAVAFLLLMACANVANLLLVRGAGRRKEIAIRSALGANQWRLVREVLTESVVLAVTGGILGIAVGITGTHLLSVSAPKNVPNLWTIHLDWRVIAYTLGISLLTGLLFGLAPSLHIFQTGLVDSLKQGGQTSQTIFTGGTRTALLVSEIAVALVLLVGAGLMIRTITKLQGVNLGFDPQHVGTLGVALDADNYTPEQRLLFYEQARERIRQVPGVRGVGISTSLPLVGADSVAPFDIEGHPASSPRTMPRSVFHPISAGYFESLGIHLSRGRYIDEADVENKHPIVVINETFAQHVWPNENPIGKRIREGTSSSDALWKEVVGVVGDVKQNGLDTETEFEAYEPYSLDPPLAAEIVFSADSPTAVISGVRATLHSLNSGLPLADALTMDQILAARLAPQRFTLAVMGVFAALALVLAVIGIYAVMSYMVTQRVQEIGIRIALGATPGRVFYMLGKQAFTWTIAGLLVGTIIALALKRFIVSILFGVSSADPLTFVIVWVVLIGVALLASYLPARRATKIDPLIALRAE